MFITDNEPFALSYCQSNWDTCWFVNFNIYKQCIEKKVKEHNVLQRTLDITTVFVTKVFVIIRICCYKKEFDMDPSKA